MEDLNQKLSNARVVLASTHNSRLAMVLAFPEEDWQEIFQLVKMTSEKFQKLHIQKRASVLKLSKILQEHLDQMVLPPQPDDFYYALAVKMIQGMLA